jgi:hypothetical protein
MCFVFCCRHLVWCFGRAGTNAGPAEFFTKMGRGSGGYAKAGNVDLQKNQ